MRGNHRILGRAEPPRPNVTTAEERALILACELRAVPDRRTWKEVWSESVLLGQVRTTFGGMEYRRTGEEAMHAGNQWGDDDPPHCLAILALIRRD